MLAKKTATPPTYVAETQTKYNQIKSFMQKKSCWRLCPLCRNRTSISNACYLSLALHQ